MLTQVLLAGLVAQQAVAFPFVATQPGVDNSLWSRTEKLAPRQSGSASQCPNNPTHNGAAPYSAQYPYCGAKNGGPGNLACSNNLVPATGDTAHQYTAPGPLDIRGPCPGINAAANHNFLSHDGITTFSELTDMQQNVYGVGYDLAILLATLGVGLDGDIVSGKLSIGCDANTRTSTLPLLSDELGLDGHNKFEGDTSLTRNDYFLANGDNYHFNGSLFGQMAELANNDFSLDNIAQYRYNRYQQSLNENGQFYFGPKSLLLYGAASFLYELFPSNQGPATLDIEKSFFGAEQQGDEWVFNGGEQIPANWYSRTVPYSIPLVAAEIFKQYMLHPVMFGANTGTPNSFVGVGENFPLLSVPSSINQTGIECALYQVATENVPSQFSNGLFVLSDLTEDILGFMRNKIGPVQASSPCPISYNYAGSNNATK